MSSRNKKMLLPRRRKAVLGKIKSLPWKRLTLRNALKARPPLVDTKPSSRTKRRPWSKNTRGKSRRCKQKCSKLRPVSTGGAKNLKSRSKNLKPTMRLLKLSRRPTPKRLQPMFRSRIRSTTIFSLKSWTVKTLWKPKLKLKKPVS